MRDGWVVVWSGRGSTANWLHHELRKLGLAHRVVHLLGNVTDPESVEEMAIETPDETRVREAIDRIISGQEGVRCSKT